MSCSSILKAEQARRGNLAVSLEQRRELRRLALTAGVPMPHVYSMAEASAEIDRLRGFEGQPQLAGFSASTGEASADA